MPYLGLRSAQEVHGSGVMRQQGHGHPFSQSHVLLMMRQVSVVRRAAEQARWWRSRDGEDGAAGRRRCHRWREGAQLRRAEHGRRWRRHSRWHQRTGTTG